MDILKRCFVPRYQWLAAILCAALPCAAATPGPPPRIETAYRHMYNLEFEQAHRCLEQWQAAYPEDPLGPVSDAAAYLFSELERMHILQGELFLNDGTFTHRRHLLPDPVIRARFENALETGREKAERMMAREPDDERAMFASILGLGVHADYLALVEQSYFASLREVKAGRIMAERLLQRDPACYDAYLAIGVENYVLSLRPMPLRWLLRLGGAQADKEVGLEKLRLTAEKGNYLKPYARLLLAVAALRDKDLPHARELLQGLAVEFPHNRLYAEELARFGAGRAP